MLLRLGSFKPYYKWNTFNTVEVYRYEKKFKETVLNLIINGIPSILYHRNKLFVYTNVSSFKPYYKWNTFNTQTRIMSAPIINEF